MPFGTRTMTSNGSSGSSIQTQINEQNKFVDTKLNQLDLQLETIESLKKDIDYRTNSLLDRLTNIDYPVNGTTTEEKVAALQSLKNNGIEYFILNFDTTNSNSEYAPKIAYIQGIFNGLKTRNPTDEWVVSYERPPSPLEEDIAKQIDAKITQLQGASVQAQPAKGLFSSFFGRGGRKQKRTKKGRKNSKRKTKKHKKKRTRRR